MVSWLFLPSRRHHHAAARALQALPYHAMQTKNRSHYTQHVPRAAFIPAATPRRRKANPPAGRITALGSKWGRRLAVAKPVRFAYRLCLADPNRPRGSHPHWMPICLACPSPKHRCAHSCSSHIPPSSADIPPPKSRAPPWPHHLPAPSKIVLIGSNNTRRGLSP